MCPDDDISSICSKAGLIPFFKKACNITAGSVYICVCVCAHMPALHMVCIFVYVLWVRFCLWENGN